MEVGGGRRAFEVSAWRGRYSRPRPQMISSRVSDTESSIESVFRVARRRRTLVARSWASRRRQAVKPDRREVHVLRIHGPEDFLLYSG